MRHGANNKGILAAILAVAWMVSPASPADAKEPVRISLSAGISSFGTPHDLAIGRDGNLPVGQVNGTAPEKLDYVRFAHELVAFVLKEVLDESGDEYAGYSLLPSQLSTNMPETDSDFKEHCLEIVGRVGTSLAPDVKRMVGPSVRNAVSTILQTGSAAFAASQIWKSLRDADSGPDGSGDSVSLRPKVGTNKVSMAVTVRW